MDKNKLYCKINCESEVVEQSESDKLSDLKRKPVLRALKLPTFSLNKPIDKFKASPHRIVFPKRKPVKSNKFSSIPMEIYEMKIRPGESIDSNFRVFRNQFFFWSLDEDIFSYNFMKDNIYQNTLKSYVLFFNEIMTNTMNLVKGHLIPDFCYQISKDIYHMILKDESFEVILGYHNIKEYLEILLMTTCK
jgi:hypothetical protein